MRTVSDGRLPAAPPGRDIAAVGWAALLTLTVTPFLPGRAVIIDLAAVAGLLVLAQETVRRKRTLLPNRTLGVALGAFTASAILSTVLPPLLLDQGWAGVARNAHALWATAQALTAAGLCLALLRTDRDFAFFCLVVAGVVGVTALWGPPDLLLRGRLGLALGAQVRLVGSKGTAHRWAQALYLGLFPVWMIIVSGPFRRIELTGRGRAAGLAVIVLAALALLRKDIPTAGPDTSWLPGLDAAARPETFWFLIAAVAAAGAFGWRTLLRPGRVRLVALIVIVLLAALNAAASAARLHTVLVLTAGAAALLHRLFDRPRALVGFAAAGAVLLGVLLMHPTVRNADTLRQRLLIWRQTAVVLRRAPVLGVGYGDDAFRAAWRASRTERRDALPPDRREVAAHKVYHPHNLWLALMVQRGAVGVLAFHLLWIAVAATLYRAFRTARPPGDEDLPEEDLRRCVAGMALVAVGLLAVDGVLNWPVARSGERLLFIVAGVGLAAARGIVADDEPPATEAPPAR